MLADLLDDDDVLLRDSIGLVCREDVLDLVDIVDEHALVPCDNRDDVVQAEITEYAAFDLDLLGVGLPLNLVSGFELMPGKDMGGLEHPDG